MTPLKTWLDPMEGLPITSTIKAESLPPNMPPLDGGAWMIEVIRKAKAKLKAEEARMGKPVPLPKVW